MVGVFAGIPGQTRAELLTTAPQPAQLTVTDDVAIHTVTHATVETRHGVAWVVVLTLGSMVALDTRTPVNKNTYMVWLEKTHSRCKTTTHLWSH